jgi:hypothetical protein
MVDEIKLRKKIIHKVFKKIRGKNYSCFYPGCCKKAIGSHSQSKSSSLKSIEENGLVISLHYDAFANDPTPKWEPIGINKVSKFPGFCAAHDNELFKKVDSISSNPLTYLVFRTFAMEMRKKEIEADKIDLLLNYLKKENCNLPDIPNETLVGLKNCLKVTKPFYLNYFGDLLTSSIEPGMVHKIFKLNENIGVSCSTFINPVPILEQPLDKPQPIIAFNILPRKNYSLVAFSCIKKDHSLLDMFIENNSRIEDLIFNFCEEITLNPTFFNGIMPLSHEAITRAILPWHLWDKIIIPDLFNIKLKNSQFWELINE